MISTFMACQGVAGLAVLQTNLAGVALIAREVTAFHVQLHGTEVVPSPPTEVARIALDLLRAVLPCKSLKIARP